jgi:acyl-CoA thioester hydrolase
MEAQGMKLAVSDAQLRYHAGAKYDDLIRVETRLTEVRSRGIRFAYVIRNATTGQQLVSATTSLVSLDAAGKLVALRADVRDMLAKAVEAA